MVPIQCYPWIICILIYSYNYHLEPNGIAFLMTELAEGLVSQGHQVLKPLLFAEVVNYRNVP